MINNDTTLEKGPQSRPTKPGPPKEFPVRLDIRIADTDRDALISIAKQTGEGHSEIIRRLIRESNNQ